MSVDILGTSCDQCRSMVQYSYTSTETRRLVRTDSPGWPPRLSHSSWTMISVKTLGFQVWIQIQIQKSVVCWCGAFAFPCVPLIRTKRVLIGAFPYVPLLIHPSICWCGAFVTHPHQSVVLSPLPAKEFLVMLQFPRINSLEKKPSQSRTPILSALFACPKSLASSMPSYDIL